MKRKGQIRIGTSNVTVPGNKNTFPADFRLTSRLHYYSSIFDTVEVNSCFYKTPMLSTYEKWTLDVPDDFQFSLKLSKEITHVENPGTDIACMEKFMRTAGGTGAKKGCLLVQFPGKITLDYFSQLELILDGIQKQDPLREWRIAVEFRNSSWYIGETYELLNEYGAAAVLHDFKKGKLSEDVGKAAFVYMRFHGPRGDYRDSYEDSFLSSKATHIRAWLQEGKDVYIYFNNTIGNAFYNALSLKANLEQ
jgi:uncharacterized protein YecE (DUF72 family)